MDEQESLEQLNKRFQEMEEEAKKLKELQSVVEQQLNEGGDKVESDSRSCYLGNVDYSSTPEEVQAHFQSCGNSPF